MVTPDMQSSPVPLIPVGAVAHSGRAIEGGALHRVTRGIYAPRDRWRTLAPWERYRARVHAASMRHPDATYALESAAALHGLPLFGEPSEVHVLGGDDTRSRMSGGVRVHTTSEPRELVRAEGVPATSLTDTVVDLARARHHAVGLAVADAALRLDPTLRVEHLVACNESRASSRGRRHARWAHARVRDAWVRAGVG
jgi:hypothetical protein